MIIGRTTIIADPPAADPVRRAAADLHRQFVEEMLKQAKLGEALGAGSGADGLSGALSSVAIGRIAADVAASQPAFTEALYAALRDSSA